jgi:hypothetical protein
VYLRGGRGAGTSPRKLGSANGANQGVVMRDYQLRVVQERKELSEKLEKLEQFLMGNDYLNLAGSEQNRLVRQTLIMVDYRDVLDERIAYFGE